MLKSELNAYLGVLKAVAKSSKLETLKSIAITEGSLQATNLDLTATLSANLSAEGIFDNAIADLLKIDMALSVELDGYKNGELRDWPEVKPQAWGRDVRLDIKLAKGNIGELICHALGFVSTDVMRPNLQCVWLTDNTIVATDGYRAFSTSRIAEIEGVFCGLRPDLLKQFKKVAKYGQWVLTYSAEMVKLTNGDLTLIGKIADGMPAPVANLMSANKKYTHKIVLPYKQLKAVASKEFHELTILSDGKLLLNNRPLPFSATLDLQDYEYDDDQMRGILCGLQGDQTRLDVNLLGAFSPDKNGNITLRGNLFDRNGKVFGVAPLQ